MSTESSRATSAGFHTKKLAGFALAATFQMTEHALPRSFARSRPMTKERVMLVTVDGGEFA